jgi:hypothetical protein
VHTLAHHVNLKRSHEIKRRRQEAMERYKGEKGLLRSIPLSAMLMYKLLGRDLNMSPYV